jgi:hypothetical protein
LHGEPQLNQVHVVEQNDVRAGLGGLFDLFQRVGFDFDFQFCGNFCARARWTAAAMAFGFSFRSAAR